MLTPPSTRGPHPMNENPVDNFKSIDNKAQSNPPVQRRRNIPLQLLSPDEVKLNNKLTTGRRIELDDCIKHNQNSMSMNLDSYPSLERRRDSEFGNGEFN
jgi:hypothetical protein